MTAEQTSIVVNAIVVICGLVVAHFKAKSAIATEALKVKTQTETAAADLKLQTAKAAAEVKARLEQQDRAALTAAAEVKAQLEIAQADYLLKLEVIRIEGNSRMTAQKKKTMEIARALASSTHDHDHLSQARVAEADYEDHLAAQHLADERVRLFVESEKMKILDAAHRREENTRPPTTPPTL